jgi:hypothetical protein
VKQITMYQVKAIDCYHNVSVMHEVREEAEAKELEEWVRKEHPTHHVFIDYVIEDV